MPSPLAQIAIDLIAPSVGEFIATAKVRAACRMAGLDLESLEDQDLEAFVEEFRKICATGLGGRVSETLVRRLIDSRGFGDRAQAGHRT